MSIQGNSLTPTPLPRGEGRGEAVSLSCAAPRIDLLPGDRLHLQEGPIDLVIGGAGAPAELAAAFRQAIARFEGLLQELVAELPLLRAPLGEAPPPVRGPVARRMASACRPLRAHWITPMAAVAGAVADEVLAAAVEGRRLDKLWVNDGGDVAFHLAPGAALDLGLVSDLASPLPRDRARIGWDAPVRGCATSGRQGRSLSRGIADAVTVLARSAAEADAAATLIANAVDVAHPAVRRAPARSLDPDSDLGAAEVVTAVGPLPESAVRAALDAGESFARQLVVSGAATAVVVYLAGRARVIGEHPLPVLDREPVLQTAGRGEP